MVVVGDVGVDGWRCFGCCSLLLGFNVISSLSCGDRVIDGVLVADGIVVVVVAMVVVVVVVVASVTLITLSVMTWRHSR